MDFLLETTSNQLVLYFLHFLGSFFDGFIFSNFFIAGEIFFLSGGYLSADYLNFLICYFSLVFGACLGDNLSYFFGKKYGEKIFYGNKIKFLSKEKLEKGGNLLKKHGVKIIFLSRFIGPFYWLTPAISGVFGFDYKKFFIFNLAGIFVGVLQFMAYGYFFAIGFSYFGNSFFINLLLLIAFVYILFLFFINTRIFFIQKNFLKIFFQFLKYVFLYFLIFVFILIYYYFFLYPKDSIFYDKNAVIKNIEEYIGKTDRKIFSDKIVKTNSNPINLVIVTEDDLGKIMEKIGWIENMSFSSGKINFSKFLELFFGNNPPISDFYHNGFNQNFQFQDFSKTSAKRSHIRFWEVGKTEKGEKIFLASVSDDKNFAIMINNGLPVIGHSIYKNIDFSRDYFVSILSKNIEKMEVKTLEFFPFSEKNYFTDGKIYLMKIKK